MDVSQDDIREGCREIQDGWTDEERARRAVGVREMPWRPPLVKVRVEEKLVTPE